MNELTRGLLLSSALLCSCQPEADESPRADAGMEADSGQVLDELLRRSYVDKLESCGLFEPSADPWHYAIEDDYDRCNAQCAVEAPCEQLEDFVCTTNESAFVRCSEACADAPADGFLCSDGSRIAHGMVCDLLDDCPKGEDEADCGEFSCADGEIVPIRTARCDLVVDCRDGSDEQGCAFSCE